MQFKLKSFRKKATIDWESIMDSMEPHRSNLANTGVEVEEWGDPEVMVEEVGDPEAAVVWRVYKTGENPSEGAIVVYDGSTGATTLVQEPGVPHEEVMQVVNELLQTAVDTDYEAVVEPTAEAEGGEKKYTYKCDTCGENYETYECCPRPMSRVCHNCDDEATNPQNGNDWYDSATRTARFKLKSYRAGSRGVYDYKPEVDQVGDVYVVTTATASSELLDIYFQCNIGSLMLQSRGGLELSDIKGIYKDSDEAMLHAQRLIDQAKEQPQQM